jgi:hypothetical protein
MKPILVFPAPKALETPKSVFESSPTAGFQKPILIVRISGQDSPLSTSVIFRARILIVKLFNKQSWEVKRYIRQAWAKL